MCVRASTGTCACTLMPTCMSVHPRGPVYVHSRPCACIHGDARAVMPVCVYPRGPVCACTHAHVHVRASKATCVSAITPVCMCLHTQGPVHVHSRKCACIHGDLYECSHARVRASTGTCVRVLMHTLPTARHLHPPCWPHIPVGHCMPLGECAPHPALCGGCPVHLAVVPSWAEAG